MLQRLFTLLYDPVMRLAERAGLAELRRPLAEPAHGLGLEVAAGTGLQFPHYPRDATVVATDPDLALLDRARARARDAGATVLLVAADAEALPFRAARFDWAVIGLALCTIPHPEVALRELRRALRPGAAVRLLEHVRVDRPVVGRLQDWATPAWKRLAGGCHLNRDALGYVRASGLEVDEVTPIAGGAVLGIAAHEPAPRGA